MKVWCYDPQSGGKKIPPSTQDKVKQCVAAYEVGRPWYPSHKLKLRFRGQFCYIDVSENDSESVPLARLRHFKEDSWSFAFYTYSNERYEPCIFPHGQQCGTIEQAIAVCEMYLL